MFWKFVKPDKCVAVEAVFNRDFRHLLRLKTVPTDGVSPIYVCHPIFGSSTGRTHMPENERFFCKVKFMLFRLDLHCADNGAFQYA